MPDRTVNLVIAVAGCLLVVCFLVLGLDIDRAARTGPRWKRRFVGAGLALLGLLGFSTGASMAASEAKNAVRRVNETPEYLSEVPVEAPAASGQNLAQASAWKHLASVWKEAEEVASGQRGAYPFDQAGRARLLADLEKGKADVEVLKKAGLLSASEAGLLQKDLELLVTGVQRKRPVELRQMTCYIPLPSFPAQESLERLSARLPLLETLAASKTVQPQVLVKVLDTVERDLAVLARKEVVATLPAKKREEAEKTRDAAKMCVDRLRMGLRGGASAFQTSREWETVVKAWQVAVPLAESGQSTTRQREAVKGQLEAATDAAQQLAAAGLLSRPEAELLGLEAKRLLEQIYSNPPTDSQVLCYEASLVYPAKASYDWLSRRLPLLERMAAEGRVHPAVLQKVIGSIEADLNVLSSEDQLKSLEGEEHAKAEQTRAQVGAALAELRALVAKTR